MDITEKTNPKDSNVYRMNNINKMTTLKGSYIYRKIEGGGRTTPKGSYLFFDFGFSINMLSLRDKKRNFNIFNFATTCGEIAENLPNAEQLAQIFNTDAE